METMMNDIMVFNTELTAGQRFLLARHSLGLRQIDVAVRATDWLNTQDSPYCLYKVNQKDVFALEKNHRLHWAKMRGICHVLGITWEGN